jgi:hypothetical protein
MLVVNLRDPKVILLDLILVPVKFDIFLKGVVVIISLLGLDALMIVSQHHACNRSHGLVKLRVMLEACLHFWTLSSYEACISHCSHLLS